MNGIPFKIFLKLISNKIIRCSILHLFLLFFSAVTFSQSSLVSPSHNSILLYGNISFEWNIDNGNNCEFQIDNNNDFTSSTNYIINNNDTTLVLIEGSYFWRVKSLDGNWSPTRTFTLINMESLGTLSFWFVPDSSNLILSGESVLNWTSSALNPLDMSQTNSILQPTLSQNSINGYPSIYFDGNDQLNSNTSV